MNLNSIRLYKATEEQNNPTNNANLKVFILINLTLCIFSY